MKGGYVMSTIKPFTVTYETFELPDERRSFLKFLGDKLRCFINWLTENNKARGKAAKWIGIWGVRNLDNMIPLSFFVRGELVPESTLTVWPLGLVEAYREQPPRLVDGRLYRVWYWCWPWQITYKVRS